MLEMAGPGKGLILLPHFPITFQLVSPVLGTVLTNPQNFWALYFFLPT